MECTGVGIRAFISRPRTVIRGFSRSALRGDVIAGLTVAAVAIPQAIAYASIAELPPQAGLYTAMVGAIVGSLWGCSRFLATGPVNASSLLVLPILLAVAAPGTPEYLLAAGLVAVLAGALGIVLALLRFGALVTLASRSVLIGFTTGAAIHIAVGQTRHLLGLHLPAEPELYQLIHSISSQIRETNVFSLAVGLGTLVLVVAFGRIGRRVPAALFAIAVAGAAVWFFDLQALGVEVVGAIPRSLPPPTWVTTRIFPNMHLLYSVAVGSMAVAALGLIEASAASQTLARRAGDRLNSNQEFFGQGLANIATGLLSGYPCSGSFTRSALAYQTGARTHLTGVITGIAILIGVLLFAPIAGLIPKAAIAGVLLVVAWGMLDTPAIMRVIRTSRGDAAIMGITFAATIFLPLDFAVLSGVVFSLAFFVIRSSLPRVVPVVPDPTYRHFVNNPDAPACPQLGVMNIRGPLFFGAVYHLEEELRHNYELHPGQDHLVLRLHGVDICDLTGIEMLEATVQTYRKIGGDVFLVRPRKPVLDIMEQSGFLDETLRRDHLLEQEGAIEFLFDNVLDPAVCIYECEHRVFAECQALEKHAYSTQLPPTPRLPTISGRHVSPKKFLELASDSSAVLLDIREPSEFQAGHIAGASLYPLRQLSDIEESIPHDRTLLLSCRSGRRTARATRMLEDMGYTDLYGIRGGILAWRAEGLPIVIDSAASRGAGNGDAEVRDELEDHASILANARTDDLIARTRKRIAHLSATYDLEELRQAVEEMIPSDAPREGGPSGVVTLDSDQPVLVISDLHGQRRAFYKLLRDRYLESASNLESLIRGDLQLLCLGDIMHSENESRWRAIEDELLDRSADALDLGPTPTLDREMADGYGLAAMILTLQHSTGNVHFLKGNHDNILNVDNNGNRKINKYISFPGEGAISRDWTVARFGPGFAGTYAAWEDRLPVFAVYDGGESGLSFAASHAEPARVFHLGEIEQRSTEVVEGLTWSEHRGTHVPQILKEVFGDTERILRFFVSHTAGEEGIVHLPGSRLVILSKPRHLVATLVRPGVEDFELHIVSSA